MKIKIVICTCQKKQTDEIIEHLLKKRLVAGVNVISGIRSRYWWKDKLETGLEDFLVMETKQDLVPGIIEEIKSIHSYETPKIISLDVEDGFKPYLSWVEDETI